MIAKGSWVSVYRVLLDPAMRSANLPPETAATPFILWMKGHLTADAEIGDRVEIVTRTGRTENGILEKFEPNFVVNYGDFVPEILEIGDRVRPLLRGGAARE